jgi:hypothetical protein
VIDSRAVSFVYAKCSLYSVKNLRHSYQGTEIVDLLSPGLFNDAFNGLVYGESNSRIIYVR